MSKLDNTLMPYRLGMKELVSKLEILNDSYNETSSYNLMESIQYRIKTKDSICKKLQKDGLKPSIQNYSMLNDVAGVRVIVAFKQDIQTVKNLVLTIPNIKVIKEKDFIENPKANGYMSYHMILDVPVVMSNQTTYVRVELQIRTILMDAWASLEHKMIYKGTKRKDMIEIFKNCASELVLLDNQFDLLKLKAIS